MNAQGIDQVATNALADANTVLATRGRSFYWARHLLGARHATRATRLYRFCRHIDDLADEATSPASAKQSLDQLQQALIQQHATDPLVADALALMHECGIDCAVMLALIQGVESDLEEVRIADESSLLRYCYQVAGTVGIMMCRVLDVDDDMALRHAIDLGIAMQLTNICRDVAADAALQRRYLPASLVGDCAPITLLVPGAETRATVTVAISRLLAKAEVYYRSGEQGLHYLPAGARAGILVAARLYRAIGRRLQQRGHDYWTARTTVGTATKLGLTLLALLDLTTARDPRMQTGTRRSALQTCQHDALLHVPLAGLPFTVFGGRADHEG